MNVAKATSMTCSAAARARFRSTASHVLGPRGQEVAGLCLLGQEKWASDKRVRD
jgi:hypothetical protein